MGCKSNQIFCKDILQISYKDDHPRFLLDLEQIFLKYFPISLATDSLIMS